VWRNLSLTWALWNATAQSQLNVSAWTKTELNFWLESYVQYWNAFVAYVESSNFTVSRNLSGNITVISNVTTILCATGANCSTSQNSSVQSSNITTTVPVVVPLYNYTGDLLNDTITIMRRNSSSVQGT